ncbi:transposase, partial [Ligilactobacillus salivarius]
DFKSGKRFSSSGMSMCLINAVNHRIIDIIPERNNKFHVVTQAYTAMNKIRIRVMKEYRAGTHEYGALKRFWKLLLKNQDNVDYHRYYPRINFKYAELSDSE